ncbi:MAG: 30S ribosomal protein S7, partial [Thermoguttaceae bacterium]|nr:30S ribosomal protein S7 [Thermoguttaceae bacterium]
MSRITASKKQLKGDPVYNDLLVSKFTNCLMWDGKKTAAQKIFYDALNILAEKVADVPSIDV